MSGLENQMKFDMEFRDYSPKTIKSYLLCVSNFIKRYIMSRELIG
jgi:hypothetical protein